MMYNTRVSDAIASIEADTICPSVGFDMRIDSTRTRSSQEPNRSGGRETAPKKHSGVATEVSTSSRMRENEG